MDQVLRNDDHIYDMLRCNDVVCISSFIMMTRRVLDDTGDENLKISYVSLLFLTFFRRLFYKLDLFKYFSYKLSYKELKISLFY